MKSIETLPQQQYNHSTVCLAAASYHDFCFFLRPTKFCCCLHKHLLFLLLRGSGAVRVSANRRKSLMFHYLTEKL